MAKVAEWVDQAVGHLKVNEHLFISVVAVLIGILGGCGAVLFRHAIVFFQSVLYGSGHDFLGIAAHIPWHKKLIIPAIGGAIVGPIIYFGAREAKGHGVPEVMEAMALRGGRIRTRVTAVKILASALSIGCGGSVGREGPIVQIGSALGSTVGQMLKVSRDRMRTLVGCGAAAGIAATFNAPIAGVIFSLEILLGEFGVTTFSPLVLSSVTATVISRRYFGNVPTFILPRYEMISVWEFFLYAIMGVMVGLVALAFVSTLYKTEDFFNAIPLPDYLKPILGGLVMGGMIIYLPQTFGVGYGTIDLSLTGMITGWMLLLLIFAKIFATSVTIGGGMSGGIFAPSLFIGAMVGGFFGTVVHSLLPGSTASSGAYALVGMGGMVAAATHAPITAILIIFELTSEYTIILPLMITCIISSLLAMYVRKGSIYTIKLMRRGVVLRQGREQNIMQGILVESVMRPEVLVVRENTLLTDIIKAFQNYNVSYLQVVNENEELSGIISFRDIRQTLQEQQLGHLLIAKDVATSPVITVTPHESIEAALRKLSSTGVSQLPVVDHNNPKQVIGTIDNKDINAAYNRAALAMEAQAS
ncbi:MAG: chloride channel protein [Candidatus Hydrogenedentota bacterium]|nr:MAG: chloride channel protein [Candidatus Hydrogenedentota bacterium]